MRLLPVQRAVLSRWIRVEDASSNFRNCPQNPWQASTAASCLEAWYGRWSRAGVSSNCSSHQIHCSSQHTRKYRSSTPLCLAEHLCSQRRAPLRFGPNGCRNSLAARAIQAPNSARAAPLLAEPRRLRRRLAPKRAARDQGVRRRAPVAAAHQDRQVEGHHRGAHRPRRQAVQVRDVP